MQLTINGKEYNLPDDSGTRMLVWVLRDQLGLTGTKYGCGAGICGSCTVLIDGQTIRSCLTPASTVVGKEITTIEGLSKNGDHPLQKAWIEAQAPQCGYCQSGQIMQAAALLDENPNPSREEIKTYMNGVLCRCGTYMRIVKAIELASSDHLTLK